MSYSRPVFTDKFCIIDLNKIDYHSSVQLKNLVRCLGLFDSSTELVDFCVLTDVRKAFNQKDVLTPKQKIVLQKHLIEDKSQYDVSIELGISQQGVSLLVVNGIKRLQSYLLSKKIKWTSWSDSDKEFLMSHYEELGPTEISKIIGKDKDKVINMYHALKNKEE